MQDSSQNFYKKLLGNAGENRAVKYLKTQGCKIIKRNYKTPFGEADILLQDGTDVVFVEVKMRTTDTFSTPAAAVDYRKQQRYFNIARYYFSCMNREENVRFDVIEVTETQINWIKNAF